MTGNFKHQNPIPFFVFSSLLKHYFFNPPLPFSMLPSAKTTPRGVMLARELWGPKLSKMNQALPHWASTNKRKRCTIMKVRCRRNASFASTCAFFSSLQTSASISGSVVPIEWTNQHGCGQNSKVNCEIIIQYMCGFS